MKKYSLIFFKFMFKFKLCWVVYAGKKTQYNNFKDLSKGWEKVHHPFPEYLSRGMPNRIIN